jgi:hypothetical protein
MQNLPARLPTVWQVDSGGQSESVEQSMAHPPPSIQKPILPNPGLQLEPAVQLFMHTPCPEQNPPPHSLELAVPMSPGTPHGV